MAGAAEWWTNYGRASLWNGTMLFILVLFSIL